MQYFDKNAIFENYFWHDVYVWMFECRKTSKNICENLCEICEMCEVNESNVDHLNMIFFMNK